MTQRSPVSPNGFESTLIQRLFISMGLVQPWKRVNPAVSIHSTESLETRELLSAANGGVEVLNYNFPVNQKPPADLAALELLTTVEVQDQTFSVVENSAVGTVVGTVVAGDPDPASPLSYAITAGNTNSAFAINAATGQITVSNPAALNFEVTPTFALTVTVTDSTIPETSDSATMTINLTDINEPTTITLQSTPITYVIGDDPIVVDPLAVLTPDPETPGVSFKNSRLKVSVQRPRPSDKDVIRILSSGYGPGEIHVGNTQILYEGHLIASYSGGRGTSPDLSIKFFSTATPAAVQALLRSIAFNTKSRTDPSPSRTLTFSLTNVGGQNSPTASRVINVTRLP